MEAAYVYLIQKVKGKPSCDILDVFYFWQNIFTPLNHRYVGLYKKMKGDDWMTLRQSQYKKVQYWILSDRVLCFWHFLKIVQEKVLRVCGL